jgi:hypothetical protein
MADERDSGGAERGQTAFPRHISRPVGQQRKPKKMSGRVAQLHRISGDVVLNDAEPGRIINLQKSVGDLWLGRPRRGCEQCGGGKKTRARCDDRCAWFPHNSAN